MFENVFEGIQISATAISAERRRMNLIANNLANLNTTAPPESEPYRRKIAIFQSLVEQSLTGSGEPRGRGVELVEVLEDQRPFNLVYRPGHPHADAQGYVRMPNVDMVEENVDMLAAARAYDANLSVMKSSRDMIKRIVDLITAP